MTMISLETMSKKELINLIKSRPILPTKREMLRARWYFMVELSRAMIDSALEKSHKHNGFSDIKNIKKWHEAQEEFDNAMNLHDAAEEIWKEMMCCNDLNTIINYKLKI